MRKSLTTPREKSSTKDKYATKESKIDDIVDEFADTFAPEDLSYDPHFVTEKMVQFGLMLTGVPLYSYQLEPAYRIIYSVVALEGATITLLFSRQSGKTETLAFVINTLSVLLPALAKIFPDLDQFKKGFKTGLFAPQSEQVWTTYNRALIQLNSDTAEEVMSDSDIQVELEKIHRYQLSNGSTLTGQTASVKSKIEGKTYDLVLCEESQDLDTYIVRKSISPMVTATGGTIVKIGTTGTEKNDFWYDIVYNRNKNRKLKDERLLYHWEYNYKKIIEAKREQYKKDGKKFHLRYESDVLKKLERWGKESQEFRLSFALEWDLESGMLITDEEFDRLCNKRKGLNNLESNDIVIAGLDIGKSEASTVLTIGKIVWNPTEEDEPPKIEIVHWLELHNVDYERQHHILVTALYEYGVQSLYFDYTGVGKAVGDRLMYSVGDAINITPYTFSRESKSEMWFNLISYIQQKRLIIPANNKTRETPEFRNFEEQIKNTLKYFDGPYLVCHKSQGYLDDYVDSLGLMAMAINFEVAEEVEIEEYNPFMGGSLDKLKKLSW